MDPGNALATAALALIRHDEHFMTVSLSPPSRADQGLSFEEPGLNQQLVGDQADRQMKVAG